MCIRVAAVLCAAAVVITYSRQVSSQDRDSVRITSHRPGTYKVVDEREFAKIANKNISGKSLSIPSDNDPCAIASTNFSPLQLAYDREPDEDKRAKLLTSQFLEKAVAYRTTCFRKLDISEPFTPRAEIESITGVLSYEGVQFCMAVKVEANAILTARHCFYDKHDNQALKSAKNLQNVKFNLLADPGTQYSVTTINHFRLAKAARVGASIFIPHREDRIVLTLDRSIKSGQLAQFSIPANDEKLWLAGLFTYDNNPTVLQAAGSACKVVIAANGCILHGCQTSPGFSGAPIFAIRTSRIIVIGLHIASANDDGQCAIASKTKYQGNLGAIIAPYKSNDFLSE